VEGWQVELGNFSVNMIGNTHLLDPRPTWSNEPAAITVGRLALGGKVSHPDPPIVLVFLPNALGHLELSANVGVKVTGNTDNGWQLQFSGLDGNFYVRLSLDAHDGDGTQWHGETFVNVLGDQLQLPPEYTQYKADCDAKYREYMRNKLLGMGVLEEVAQVQPGQPVTNSETREAIAVRTLVNLGDPAALTQLVAAAERFGPGILSQIGRVSALQLTKTLIAGSGQK
jgi:hypothetical protein